jgi:peptidoglycan DL-endopeptidase CwlO
VRFSARRVMMAIAVMAFALPVLGVAAAPAPADAITDMQAKAAQIAQKLDQLGVQIDQLGQQYDASQQQLATVNTQIAAASRQVATSNHQLDVANRELAGYAVQAYVQGGQSALPDLLLTGNGNDAVRQLAYLKAASSNQDDLIDRVRAARFATNAKLASLDAARSSAKALQTKLTSEKDQATTAMSQQQTLQASVTGQLATLVAQAQAAQAAAAEAAAKARLAAAAAPPTTVAPKPAAGSSGSTGATPGHPAPTTTVAPGHSSPPPTTKPSPTTTAPGDGGSSTGPVIPIYVPPGTPPPVLAAAANAIAVARTFLGMAYVWGGASPSTGFDCSGLVQWSFRQAGVSLPRVADAQAAATRHVTYAQALPGDLVFFDSPDIGHVGIYLGGGMMIDAPHTGAVIRIESIWWPTLVGFGRVV